MWVRGRDRDEERKTGAGCTTKKENKNGLYMNMYKKVSREI